MTPPPILPPPFLLPRCQRVPPVPLRQVGGPLCSGAEAVIISGANDLLHVMTSVTEICRFLTDRHTASPSGSIRRPRDRSAAAYRPISNLLIGAGALV